MSLVPTPLSSGPIERVRQTARRKEIYETLHPETKAQVAGALGTNKARGNAVDNLSTASFADATAAAMGNSARSVRRDAMLTSRTCAGGEGGAPSHSAAVTRSCLESRKREAGNVSVAVR